MITIPELVSYASEFDCAPKEPLRITLFLRWGALLLSYDQLCLDNLLARCALDVATDGARLTDTNEPYDLPTPLQCLWRNERGLPLWAATPFMPAGQVERDVFYQHKRAQTGGFTAARGGRGYGVQVVSGRWMERRTPLPMVMAERFEATCIGNARLIGRLLDPLTHAGKRRAIGFGEIDHWLIEPLGHAFTLLDDGLRLARAMPAGAIDALFGAEMRPTGEPVPVGWTPPQWKPSLFSLGWMAGTPVEVDWYEAAGHD